MPSNLLFLPTRKPEEPFIIIFVALAIIAGLIIFDKAITKKITESSTFSRLKGMIQQGNLNAMLIGRADTLWKLAVPMIKDYRVSVSTSICKKP